MNPRLIGALATLALLTLAGWLLYDSGYTEGQTDERAVWTENQKTQLKQYNEEVERNRKAEQTLRNQADKLRQDTDREITRLNANLDHVLTELHKRPKRPAAAPAGAMPPAASPGPAAQGCDGSQLFGEDAGFLARESATTTYLRLQLAKCHATYNRGREAVNGTLIQNLEGEN